MNKLFISPDQDYIEQNTIWIAKLNNGQVAYQYDIGDRISWLKLFEYCKETGQYIIFFSIRFRSNLYELPQSKNGYFFCKSILGGTGMKKPQNFYLAGFLENDAIEVHKITVPSLILDEIEYRVPDFSSYCLIKKP